MEQGMIRKFSSWILVIVSVLLGAAVLAFVVLSSCGTRRQKELAARAEAVFGRDWAVSRSVPVDLPVQQVFIIGKDGKVEASYPPKPDSAVDYLEHQLQTGDFSPQVAAAVGRMLEPLVDRYPYIGRSPTFLIKSYPQPDGKTVAAALWLPLPTRLIWTSYAALIYLYLIHWLASICWVYLDTRERGVYPWKWTVFAALANIAGLIAYLAARKRERG